LDTITRTMVQADFYRLIVQSINTVPCINLRSQRINIIL